MGYLRSEEEVDLMIAEMMSKNKGNYITQGVSFNKNSVRQMELLKMVLMRSSSFSGFIKELLAQYETTVETNTPYHTAYPTLINQQAVNQMQSLPFIPELQQKSIDTGNFL